MQINKDVAGSIFTTGEDKFKFEWHSASFLPDGRTLVYVSRVMSISFSRSGKTLVLGLFPNAIHL